MTLEQILEIFRNTSMSHVDIQSFDYGEDFLMNKTDEVNYPTTFLEIPYDLNYGQPNERWKELRFSFLVLIASEPDDVKGDHINISNAEQIGEAILTKIITDHPELAFQSINGFSVREFSDNRTAGIRYDIVVKIQKNYCVGIGQSFNYQFNLN